MHKSWNSQRDLHITWVYELFLDHYFCGINGFYALKFQFYDHLTLYKVERVTNFSRGFFLSKLVVESEILFPAVTDKQVLFSILFQK